MVFADLFEIRLQEQHVSFDTKRVHKQKRVEGCRDGSAKNHMN